MFETLSKAIFNENAAKITKALNVVFYKMSITYFFAPKVKQFFFLGGGANAKKNRKTEYNLTLASALRGVGAASPSFSRTAKIRWRVAPPLV